MSSSMTRMAAQELPTSPVRERHNQAIRLSEIQRPLGRRLGLPCFPESIPDDRLHEQARITTVT